MLNSDWLKGADEFSSATALRATLAALNIDVRSLQRLRFFIEDDKALVKFSDTGKPSL